MRHEMRKKIHKFNIRKWIIKLFKELIEHLLKEHIALSKIVSNDGIPRTNNTPNNTVAPFKTNEMFNTPVITCLKS